MMRINKIINNMVYEGLIEKINEEVSIECQDKIQLYEDGVDISKIYVDDFNILKKLLYKDVDYIKSRLTSQQVHELIDYINFMIEQSITYIKYDYVYRKGVTR